MDEHHNWYNVSMWHIDWPYQVYVGQRLTFYGPAILLHILMIIWWRNVVLGIMDQFDVKIGLVLYVSQWPIFHGPMILPYIIVIDLIIFIHTEMVPAVGIRVLPGTCSSMLWNSFNANGVDSHQKLHRLISVHDAMFCIFWSWSMMLLFCFIWS